jgi:hypothetical protein
MARIGYNGGYQYLGTYDTPEEAYQAYHLQALWEYGEYSLAL